MYLPRPFDNSTTLRTMVEHFSPSNVTLQLHHQFVTDGIVEAPAPTPLEWYCALCPLDFERYIRIFPGRSAPSLLESQAYFLHDDHRFLAHFQFRISYRRPKSIGHLYATEPFPSMMYCSCNAVEPDFPVPYSQCDDAIQLLASLK